MNNIGDTIKKILVERNLFQADLSRMTGLPNTSLQNIFSHVTKDPKVSMMNSIAQALGLSIYDIIGYQNVKSLHKEFYKHVIFTIEQYAEKRKITLTDAKKKFMINEVYQFALKKVGTDKSKLLEIDMIYFEWLFKSSNEG